MAKFDPVKLFATKLQRFDRSKQPYPTEEAGLDGIKAGKKSMEMLTAAIGDVTSARTDLEYLIDQALRRDLSITLVRGPRFSRLSADQQPILIYVTKPDQTWRVPAMLAVRATALEFSSWTDATENLISHLLGYTPAQRKKWIAYQRQQRPARGASTVVYALLDADQRKRVESVGRRCFGPAEALVGFTLLRSGFGERIDAIKRIPKGMTFARVGVRFEAVESVFGPFKPVAKRTVFPRTLTKQDAAKISAALTSNVQFLTKRGWS